MVYIEELRNYISQEVEIRGWCYNIRSKGKIIFIIIRDGTGFLQCIASADECGEDRIKMWEGIPQESSIIVKGIVREDKRSPGGVELSIRDLQIVQRAFEYPIALKEHSIEFLLDRRHLWLRSKRPFATLRVRAKVIKAIRDFFDSRGFVLVDAPIFTPSACEGTTTLFEVNYFGDKAYLSQSGQLYMEAACMALGKVYCFGPTFRAEKSKTRRHLVEFWMVEPEVAYATLDDVIKLAEDLICYIVEYVLDKAKEELKILERDTKPLEVIKAPFPKISYNSALELLSKKGIKIEWGSDFGAVEETTISESFEKPVMVHRYPMQCKAFYMKQDPEDERLALCVDVLAPEGIGEIIGGGQRADDLEYLERKIREHNLPEAAFNWYLDLRKYGTCPHAGFGLGIERTVAWICGLQHVREAIPFPRTIYRKYP